MVHQVDLPYASDLVRLSAGGLRAFVNPERGGDILSLVHERSGIEVLWLSRKAQREHPQPGPLRQDVASFYDKYPGGIQELFPNTADSTFVKGAQLPFHGEACRVPWSVVGKNSDLISSVTLRTHLSRSPIKMEKTVSLNHADPILTIRSSAENLSGAQIPFSWAFHPAFGEALLEGGCTVYLPSNRLDVHPERFSDNQSFQPGSSHELKRVGPCGVFPLRTGTDFGADLLYARCSQGWLIARNESSGLTVTFSWDVEMMPYVWIWREFYDPAGYPWWGLENIVGLEVHSSAPARELRSLIEAGEASSLGPREMQVASLNLCVNFTDISQKPIGVNSNGMPILEGDE